MRKKTSIFMVFIVLVSIVSLSACSENNNSNSKNNKNSGSEVLELKDLTASYDAGWEIDETISDSANNIRGITLKKESVKLSFFLQESKIFTRTEIVLSDIISGNANSPDYKLVSKEPVMVNNKNWIRWETTVVNDEGTKRRSLGMLFCTNYDSYTVLYTANDNDYNTYLDEVKKIMTSVKVGTADVNTPEVKEKIVGEWDWGVMGYLVINNDNTYRFSYKDSANRDTVIYGTYESRVGVPVNNAKYEDGIFFLGALDKWIADGVEQPIHEFMILAFEFKTKEPDGKIYAGQQILYDNDGKPPHFRGLVDMTKVK